MNRIDAKRGALLLTSLVVAIVCICLILASLIVYNSNKESYKDSSQDIVFGEWPSPFNNVQGHDAFKVHMYFVAGNGTFGENVQVSFDPDEGVTILIHDEAGRVLFKSFLMMYKGFHSGQKIKVNHRDRENINYEQNFEEF